MLAQKIPTKCPYLVKNNITMLKQSIIEHRLHLNLSNKTSKKINNNQNQITTISTAISGVETNRNIDKKTSKDLYEEKDKLSQQDKKSAIKAKLRTLKSFQQQNNTCRSKQVNQNYLKHRKAISEYQSMKFNINELKNIKQSQKNTQSQNKKKLRIQTQPCERSLSRRQRIDRYCEQKLKKKSQQFQSIIRYKNQKLNILVQQHINIIKKIPEHLKDEKKFYKDISTLLQIFKKQGNISIQRHTSQEYRTFTGKLIFFIGYQLHVKHSIVDQQHKYYESVLSNYFQIYFAMRLKVPLLVMECYLQLIELALQKKRYYQAEKFAQRCLLASIYYKQKYYEERSIQKLSMCEYYKGNIYQATYLHDNNGNMSVQSARKVQDGYNQQQELDLIFHHLYEIPRFDLSFLLADYENRFETYKLMIVFKNPRVKLEESMKNKTDQIKIDLRFMQKITEFKPQAHTIRKQLSIHENLFSVKKISKCSENQFRLVKRNLVLNEENESSQILRAHQSLNRLRDFNFNIRGMHEKFIIEFVNLLEIIQSKLQ